MGHKPKNSKSSSRGKGTGKMDIDKLTVKEAMGRLEEAEQIRKIFNMPASAAPGAAADDSHWPVGKNVFIRTVTHHLVGKLVKVTPQELVLQDAAWVADDGRFSTCIKDGVVSEAEAVPDGQVLVGRAALIDSYVWNHDLIRTNKP
jgi:hypothetical protein